MKILSLSILFMLITFGCGVKRDIKPYPSYITKGKKLESMTDKYLDIKEESFPSYPIFWIESTLR